jgi:hypothetical protein
MTREIAEQILAFPGTTDAFRRRLEAALAEPTDQALYAIGHVFSGFAEVVEEPPTIEDRIKIMMACIDWERIHRVQLATDWRWGGGDPGWVPSLDETKATALILLRDAAADPGTGWRAGGMSAVYHKDSGFDFTFTSSHIDEDALYHGIADYGNGGGYRLPSSADFNMASPAGSMRPGSHTE